MTIDGQATRTDSEESPGRGQHSRKEYADRAVSFAENLMKQLDLNEQSDRKAVQSLLLSALKIEEDGWLELQFEAEYSNGGKLKFQLENPLKAQIKAEEKKQEQERKEQEKANKKAEAQDKKRTKTTIKMRTKTTVMRRGKGRSRIKQPSRSSPVRRTIKIMTMMIKFI